MEKKIIFLDIDGTLTEPGCNTPPDSALEAIEKARAKGNYVLLCTGRNYDMLSPLLRYDFDGVIASSGGYIQVNKEVIYDCPMTELQRKNAMEILEKNGVFRTVECMDGSYTDEGFKDFLKEHAEKSGNSEFLRWREQIEKSLNILPMQEYQGQPVYKIVIMSPTAQQVVQPEKVLKEDFAFCLQEMNEQGFINGEVVNRKFDKGKAVERVCRYLNIPIENTIAFGDSMNDREMMEVAGLSICMENGSAALKEISDEICPSVKEDGLAKAFVKHQLI